MGEALTIEVRQDHGFAIVTAAGEIDISTVTRLRERLFEIAASGHPLVVDLGQVGFIDSVGLSVLVGTANRAATHGNGLQVACAPPKIRQLLRLTGLDRRIALPRTLDEALGARQAARPTTRET
jgi:anti-sigma B factor antagonist